MTIYQSALPRVAGTQVVGFSGLRMGMVAAPYPADSTEFTGYLDDCLKTWTVDVVLETGEYYPACRILAPQGNIREGFRRMFKTPRQVGESTLLLGDTVVLGFLDGNPARPCVLGALYPAPIHPNMQMPLDVLGAEVYVPGSADEWRDRHEVVDHTHPENPWAAHTDVRDSGRLHHTEHRVERGTSADPAGNTVATVVTRSEDARVLTREHVVERHTADGALQTDRVVSLDDRAQTLRHHHAVETATGTATVTVEDLSAQVLALQHVVQEQATLMHQLLLRSEGAERVLLQHVTGTNPDDPAAPAAHALTLLSDGAAQHGVLLKQTPEGTVSVALEADNSLVLRVTREGAPDSRVVLGGDGAITAQAASGASLRLSADGASVRAGGAAVLVQPGLLSVSTPDGSFFSLEEGNAVVSAPRVTVNAAHLALQAGAVRVGASGAGGHFIPSTDLLYRKLRALEQRVMKAEQGLRTHTHPDKRLVSTNPGVSVGTTTSFADGAVPTDSLLSLKGD